MAKRADTREWTEYIVRARRWIRDIHGRKVWETIELKVLDEDQALYFYNDMTRPDTDWDVKKPHIVVRSVVERPYKK